MVIDEIDVRSIPAFELENYSPVARNPNRPLPFTFAAEGMQPQTGQCHIGWRQGGFEGREDEPQPLHVLRGNTPCIAAQMQTLQAFVAKAKNHYEKCNVSHLKCQ